MRIFVIMPTTGGPIVLRRLQRRVGLPHSSAFMDGDYRPLPWSGDYARLSAPDGPLSSLVPADALGPHELRLSGSFDTGRSWEAPVCLAHGLLARGHTIVGDLADADMVLWATGAVDLDLTLIPGDYALLDKIEVCRDLIAQSHGLPLVALLPPARDRDAAAQAFAALRPALPVCFMTPTTIGAALDKILPIDVPHRTSSSGSRPVRLRLAVFGGAALTAVVGFAAVQWHVNDRVPPALPPKTPEAAAQPKPRQPTSLSIDELHAAPGSSCRRVAFGADAPVHRSVAMTDPDTFSPSRLTPDLCGLAFKPARGPSDKVTVSPMLAAAALPPSTQTDGTLIIYLRADLHQNIVYEAQVNSGNAPKPRETFHQELRP